MTGAEAELSFVIGQTDGRLLDGRMDEYFVHDLRHTCFPFLFDAYTIIEKHNHFMNRKKIEENTLCPKLNI